MRYSSVALPLAASLLHPALAVPAEQPSFKRSTTSYNHTEKARAAAVKQTFQIAWDGYYTYAFPHDELHPVSNSYSDSRNGWGASAIDAFSTALLMENTEVINQILDYIPTINFDVSADNEQISLFETTIRYLGGLLSGYDLLTGPLAHLVSNTTAVDAILTQAQHLADNLKFAFDTPTGIPNNDLYVNQTTDGSTTNGLATIGTLVLEWTRLSDILGDATYGDLAQKGESYLLNPQYLANLSEPFPGLEGTNVDINTGLFQDESGGWVGGDDSFYEYLIKMYVYDSSRFAEYKDRWVTAADSSIEYVASHPSTRPDLTFLAAWDGKDLQYYSEHLACFDGGSFLLGGSVLKEQKYIDFGLELVKGCEDTYASTLTGIGPEVFEWIPVGQTNTSAIPANQTALYEKAGFWITNGNYILRPEVMESFYYAYRITKDSKYQDWAWNAFLAINSTTHVGSGYAELVDVNAPGGGGFTDFQDSFFFAEVLKYAYLIHAGDNVWDVNYDGVNQFVFNTEAHPLKVVGSPI